jgi:FG-GAP repeat
MTLAKLWKRLVGKPAQKTRTTFRLTALDERITPTVNSAPIFAVGSGPGMDATVKVYNKTGTLLDTFKPYPLNGGTFFQGGVSVAVGDIDGDGVPDVITGAGPGGGPHVKVFKGTDIAAGNANPTELRSFFAYASTFTGGVNVAAGDVNGDGLIDIITGAGPGGGPHVEAFGNGNQGSLLMSFFAYESTFRGGVSVGAGDMGGDGTTDEVVTGAGNGGGPKVGVYKFLSSIPAGTPQQKIAEFFAYDSAFRGGVNVAAGYATNNRDANNFLYADIITGPGPGGGPNLKVFRLLDAHYDSLGNPANWTYFEAGNAFPYPSSFTGGVQVGVLRNGSLDDILTGAGPGGGPDQRIFNQTSINDLTTYVPTQRFAQFVFPATFNGGIFVS